MSDASGVFMLFILVGGIILVLLLITKDIGSGLLKVGRAELRIDFHNGKGWVDTRRQPAGQPAAECSLAVKGTSWRYPLPKSQTLIGNGPDCHIRLLDVSADSHQAVIYWDGGRYKINNLSRSKPTRVNNRTFRMQNLGDGNTIRMGRTKLIFRDDRHMKRERYGPAG